MYNNYTMLDQRRMLYKCYANVLCLQGRAWCLYCSINSAWLWVQVFRGISCFYPLNVGTSLYWWCFIWRGPLASRYSLQWRSLALPRSWINEHVTRGSSRLRAVLLRYLPLNCLSLLHVMVSGLLCVWNANSSLWLLVYCVQEVVCITFS